MITVPEVVKTIVSRSPYLTDALERNIINLSELARQILPEVEEKTMKDVQVGSIVMALKRMQPQIEGKPNGIRIESEPEIIVRSNLFEVTVRNSELTSERQKNILQLAGGNTSLFTTITHGVFETTIIASNEVRQEVYTQINRESIISELSALSSITIKYAQNIIDTPGVYAQVLKQLAWHGISLTEVVSTYSELTLIVTSDVVSDAFSVIKTTFTK